MTRDGARQFDMQRCLGAGGFGEVYQAAMTSTGGLQTTIAVKVLRSDLEVSSDAVQRLRDEGRALGRLDHPAIVRAHDLTVLDGRVALITEFVDGRDLEDLVARDDREGLGLRALVQVIGPVADALDAAWRANGPQGQLYLVHRDIKPSNIRVGRHGQVKLLDFGIARFEGGREARTASDVVMGSLPFMAPERFIDRRSRSASDVFSLGCCLYEGLAGQRFYANARLTRLSALALDLEAFREEAAQRFTGLPELPTELRELVEAMLAATPDERPTAAEVARRCEALADDLPGPSLRRWCADHAWPEVPATTGSLAGRRLVEGELPTPQTAPRAASDASPPRMMTQARGTLDPSTDLPGLEQAKEAMAQRRVDTPVAPPAFPSIPLGMAVKKGDQISFKELEETLGKDAAEELAGEAPASQKSLPPSARETMPPQGISEPLPPEPASGGSRTLAFMLLGVFGVLLLGTAALIVLAAFGILALSFV